MMPGSKLAVIVLALGLMCSAQSSAPKTAAKIRAANATAVKATVKRAKARHSPAAAPMPAPAPPAATAEEVRLLREAMAQQQEQLKQLQQAMAQRDSRIEQLTQQLHVTPPAVSGGESTSSASAIQDETIKSLQADVADLKLNQTNSALSTQEDQKRVSAVEGVLGRFRFNGDVRVRQEDFFQDFNGCVRPSCAPRFRERIRLRFGVDGRINEDFTAGLYVASGVLTDPVSTNETLTNFFEKKTIGFDRGFITYNPVKHKWLSLTGGKFAYTWNRTSVTLDPDLNPEGFSEKLSWDINNAGFVKNFTAMGMQLFFNEVSKGVDSFAAGGQVSSRLQLGHLWTMTPSYTALNWRNIDSILNAAPAVTGNATVGPFAPNGLTNATFTDAAGNRHVLSQFLYSDLIINNVIKTPMPRFPFNLTGEYLVNTRAATNRSHVYYVEGGLGQQRNKGDWNFGYAFLRQEQDSVIGSFNESDQRAPTNVLQHHLYLQYKLRQNLQLAFTQWIGRTLDVRLQNAAKATGLPAGRQDPFLNRLQFDAIYSF
ncbi:MAG: hypothetical protein DMG65_14610 [Candidatus Angelobacter sp. Gp1-AA117]|nr:MAG: hypothetical protein DMG65_14610 [Candidatus Angelobacter sp. Gp1-AA117]